MMTNAKELPFEWTGRIAPDELSMDEFEVSQPSGARIRPHQGEVIWCKTYGQTISHSLETVGRTIDAFNAAARSDDAGELHEACRSMAGTICERALGWTLTDPYTGEPYPQPTEGPEAVYRSLPSALFLWLFRKLAGMEDTTARGNGSGGSRATSSAKRAPTRLRKAK